VATQTVLVLVHGGTHYGFPVRGTDALDHRLRIAYARRRRKAGDPVGRVRIMAVDASDVEILI
jgi:hypothetical protein